MQCPGVLHNVKVGCVMSRADGKVPNSVAINFCNADYSVRHLNNENDETRNLYNPVRESAIRLGGPHLTGQFITRTLIITYIAQLVLTVYTLVPLGWP